MSEYKDFIGLCIPDHPDPDHPWENGRISTEMVMNIYECQKFCDDMDECLAFDTDPTDFEGEQDCHLFRRDPEFSYTGDMWFDTYHKCFVKKDKELVKANEI